MLQNSGFYPHRETLVKWKEPNTVGIFVVECELHLKSWRVCHSILGVFSVQIINTNSSFVIRSKAVWCFSYQLFDHSNSLHTDFEYGLLSSRTDSRWVWPISKGCMHTLTLLNPPLMCPWVSVCPILNFVFSWSSPFH